MTLFFLSCIAMYADAEIFALVAKYRCSGINRRGSRDTGHPVSFVDETSLTGNIAETSQSSRTKAMWSSTTAKTKTRAKQQHQCAWQT